jgi:GNAT superfamily N-acetyltransferase
MKVSVRKGRKSDLPRVLQLIRELAEFEKMPDEVEVTLKQMQSWGFGPKKWFGFFVAETEKGIIPGMALYYYKYSTWKGRCLYLEDIIVTSSERGKGYGKLLFEAVLHLAQKEKVKRLEWQVLDWNAEAISFYKKYGAAFNREWVSCQISESGLVDSHNKL